MKTAYLYSRISTGRQGEGTGLERQSGKASKVLAYIASQSDWMLDTTFTLQDVGSAFHGSHLTKNLGIFLQAVRQGIVKAGSVFLIENFDRMDRRTPVDAFPLFLELIKAGIEIVTFMDGHARHYTLAMLRENPNLLDEVLDAMKSAYWYSQKLSCRITEMYEQKRADAVCFSGITPSWIKKIFGAVRKGIPICTGYELDAEKTPIVRRMIDLALGGMGSPAIAQTLNREGVKNIFRHGKQSDTFSYSTIGTVLRSRALIGEFTPKGGTVRKGYFPAVIENENMFLKLQSVLDARVRTVLPGRKGVAVSNLFGTLLRDKNGNGFKLKSSRKRKAVIISMASVKGLERQCTFPYAAFEHEFLRWVKEIELAPPKQTNEAETIQAILNRKLADLARLQAEYKADGKLDALLPMIKAANRDKNALEKSLQIERSKQFAPRYSGNDIAGIVARLETATESERCEVRSRIRAAIATVVRKIQIHITADGLHRRLAVCQVHLVDGSRRLFAVIVVRKAVQSDGINAAMDGLSGNLAAIGEWVLGGMSDGESFRTACASAMLINSNLMAVGNAA